MKENNVFKRLSFIKYIANIFSQGNMMVGLTGNRVGRSFYYRNSSVNRKFKGNQRKERSLFRRRKMMASAR